MAQQDKTGRWLVKKVVSASSSIFFYVTKTVRKIYIFFSK